MLDKYKFRADPQDLRDFLYTPSKTPLKESVDLREWDSTIEEQDHLGSCTGQAAVGAYELLMYLEKKYRLDLSRLFVYYNSRLVGGDVTQDEGAYIRDVIRALKDYGVCAEVLWPYHIDKFAVKPDANSYEDGKKRTIKNYYRLVDVNDILDALNNNYPVIFGMLVYDSFDRITHDHHYIVKLPAKSESPVGAHAMCLVGYDQQRQLLLARNSFGTDWGDEGYCWIPFDYAKSEFIDMWIFDINLST